LLTRALALRAEPPDYIRAEDAPVNRPRRTSRVYLGTVPDYVAEGVTGVRLSGVVKGGPAEAAGIEGGDIIVELTGREIETIHDYSYALDALKIGEPARMVVERGGERISVEITPASRE
jgi:S1-C subfamily serine protease